MRKKIVLLFSVLFLLVCFSFLWQKEQFKSFIKEKTLDQQASRKKENVPIQKALEKQDLPEIKTFYDLQNEPIPFRDVATTEELKQLLSRESSSAPIYIRNFPEDFVQKGDMDTFIRTLIPYILRQNKIILAERNALLRLKDKIEKNEKLIREEQSFFDNLVEKYQVIAIGDISRAVQLMLKIDETSPTLAIAQALAETEMMKNNLQAPFGVFRWNDNKEFIQVQYDNLAQAVEDYMLVLNQGLSYDSYHRKRAIQRAYGLKMSGRSFANYLELYKRNDKEYTKNLQKLIDDYHLKKLDSLMRGE